MSDTKPKPSTVFGSGAFIVAASILLICAVVFNVTFFIYGVELAKAAVPLERSLDEFPEQLSDRFVLAKDLTGTMIQNGKVQLTSDVIATLGTETFISWIYLDNWSYAGGSAPPSVELPTTVDPIVVRVHLAYYTGLLDATPHVPENCQIAGGLLPDPDNTGNVDWPVPGASGDWAQWKNVTLRKAGFVSDDGENHRIVYYIFSANGHPERDRLAVRWKMSSLFDKYCYYMKIELSADRLITTSKGRTLGLISPEESDAACKAFFADAAPKIFEHIASVTDIAAMEAAR